MMTIQSAWKVIVSSRSGGGKARHDWPEIANLLKAKSIEFIASITDHAYHAIELAREAVLSGFRKLLVVGGDGAVHEVLNGLYSQSEVSPSEVAVGLIPVGSGNDWSRLHRIPADYGRAVDLIAEAGVRTRLQDVACVHTLMDGKPYCRYMMNIGGLGFDSDVCRRFDIAKEHGHAGDRQYLKSLLSGFLAYRPLRFRVVVDGEEFYHGTAFSVALGIGQYCGGGMRQTPDAIPDDGLINVTVVGKLSKWKFLSKVPSLFKGDIYRHKEVRHTTGRRVEISAAPYSYMEVDGEPVGITPVRIEVIPAGVQVVSNL
ncbi:MAG: diacylglycerol kinase family lipid kinase [Bacteroidales bacterium]|nr:diacylglycerol kinase family lipid kinase [Bacteroidales bacterium]